MSDENLEADAMENVNAPDNEVAVAEEAGIQSEVLQEFKDATLDDDEFEVSQWENVGNKEKAAATDVEQYSEEKDVNKLVETLTEETDVMKLTENEDDTDSGAAENVATDSESNPNDFLADAAVVDEGKAESEGSRDGASVDDLELDIPETEANTGVSVTDAAVGKEGFEKMESYTGGVVANEVSCDEVKMDVAQEASDERVVEEGVAENGGDAKDVAIDEAGIEEKTGAVTKVSDGEKDINVLKKEGTAERDVNDEADVQDNTPSNDVSAESVASDEAVTIEERLSENEVSI